MMIDDEVYSCTCPTCGAPAYMVESGDGNGGIIPTFAYDVNWLGNLDTLFIEQGSDVPNTSGNGGGN